MWRHAPLQTSKQSPKREDYPFYICRVMGKLEIEFLRPVLLKSGVGGMEPGIMIML